VFTVCVDVFSDVFSANRGGRQHSWIGTAHILPIAGQPIPSQRRVHDSQKDIHRPNGVHATQHRFVHLRVGFLGTKDFDRDQ